MAALGAWIEAHQQWLIWLGGGSLAMLLLSPLLVAWLVAMLPADYFNDPVRHRSRLHSLHPVWWWLVMVGKNLLGAVLVIAGVAMLALPGQGLLTILLGLVLVDFPGKFRLERGLVCRPGVLDAMNWLRIKMGRDALQAPRHGAAGLAPATRERRDRGQ